MGLGVLEQSWLLVQWHSTKNNENSNEEPP
jgi:hypothetical protein